MVDYANEICKWCYAQLHDEIMKLQQEEDKEK